MSRSKFEVMSPNVLKRQPDTMFEFVMNCVVPQGLYVSLCFHLAVMFCCRDLSFNMLTGQIPDSFESLENLKYMFLTNNSLTGVIPAWIMNNKRNMDISYNNFTGSVQFGCQQSSVNLVSSLSSSDNSISWCLRKDLPCFGKAQYHSLFINCGGPRITDGKNEYEGDLTLGGPSSFISADKWAYSSTGLYLSNENADFIARNSFGLNVTGAEYYTSARLAPQSLKYYGLCMRKGSYKVRLHFAEIMYSDDLTFSSLGRRIFDVSIQVSEMTFAVGLLFGLFCVFFFFVTLISIYVHGDWPAFSFL
uniref:non-specific serine/threonine protein kinase n=1 Tax=Rhizophora mucronata TaxID=61149 RepID=A0A2P2MVJ8_RHIMU